MVLGFGLCMQSIKQPALLRPASATTKWSCEPLGQVCGISGKAYHNMALNIGMAYSTRPLGVAKEVGGCHLTHSKCVTKVHIVSLMPILVDRLPACGPQPPAGTRCTPKRSCVLRRWEGLFLKDANALSTSHHHVRTLPHQPTCLPRVLASAHVPYSCQGCCICCCCCCCYQCLITAPICTHRRLSTVHRYQQ
jgi:hypothetical protein